MIIADFSGNVNIRFYKDIYEQVGDKKLSIVIANAGVLQVGRYIDMEPWKIQQILDVNVYHYAMMQKVFLPKLIDRTKSK